MDLTAAATPNSSSPDTDNDAPPHNHPIKLLSFSMLKKHHYHQDPPVSGVVVVYGECLKNHAASLGGLALDGCGEFMPSPTANPSDPTSLECAACGCHRNFHRRDSDCYAPPIAFTPHFLDFRHPQKSFPSPSTSPPPPPPPQPSGNLSKYAPQMLLPFSSAAHEDQQKGMNHHNLQVAVPVTPTAAKAENLSGRKRFRTKFTQEQKEKMLSFSEKLGWKLQRSDDSTVEEFCNGIGVARGVLKVWMHNNKNTLGKRLEMVGISRDNISSDNEHNNNGSRDNISSDNEHNNNGSSNHDEDNNGTAIHFHHASTNGSSPSSS